MTQENTSLESLLNLIPIDSLAEKFGVDGSTMTSAVQQTLPGLLGGLAVNASDAEGAEKLDAALQKHAPASGTLDLNSVDVADGEKIVNHVLGDKQEDVALALGQGAGGGIGKLIPMLLPLLAPIVMSWLSGKKEAAPAEAEAAGSGGVQGALGDVLGGLLGGGGTSQAGSQGGLGDILGGLLGGGSSSGGAGGLGGLLGGLLGK